MLDSNSDLSKREYLQAIEQVFDPASRRRIQATEIATDWRCLEVGAGAGSIAQWSSEVNGDVVAVNLNSGSYPPTMNDELTIQQVATLTQLSGHTLRHYERIGLSPSVNRVTNRYRRYSQQDIAWIEFLTRLRATGMPIRQMQQFAELRWQDDETMLLEVKSETWELC